MHCRLVCIFLLFCCWVFFVCLVLCFVAWFIHLFACTISENEAVDTIYQLFMKCGEPIFESRQNTSKSFELLPNNSFIEIIFNYKNNCKMITKTFNYNSTIGIFENIYDKNEKIFFI